MANRWCDGFGRYGGDVSKMLNGSSGQAWAQVDTGPSHWSLSSANPRTGSWHMSMADGTGQPIARRVFGSALTQVLFGQALYFRMLPTEEISNGGGSGGSFWLAVFRNAANGMQVGVNLGTDGAVAVWCGEFGVGGWNNGNFNGTLLHRSDPVVGAGAYQHFEHYLKVGASDGAYELRVDEQTVINLTGINTDRLNGEVSQVVIGRNGGSAFDSGGTRVVDMADCFVNDTVDDGSACNTFIGDCKSGVRMVNADTAQAGFAKSSGTVGFSLLNETPPVDSSTISTASPTAESDFGIAAGPSNLSEILTVRPFVRAMKDDAGTCTIAPNMKSGGIKGSVTPQPVTTAMAYYDSNVPFDPNTAVPWMPTDLAAALEVVERTA
jgi:hypothetical protein